MIFPEQRYTLFGIMLWRVGKQLINGVGRNRGTIGAEAGNLSVEITSPADRSF
jgi:hypothetical protein